MNTQTFRLPDLGEGLTEAEIVRWLVAVGDEVTVDQCVVEVETAKSLVEVPTPYAGRVAVLHAGGGETLAVGMPLISVMSDVNTEESAATAEVADETYGEDARTGSGNVLIGYGTSSRTSTSRRRSPRSLTDPSGTSPEETRPQAAPLVTSPLVRRLARTHGVDLTELSPSGRGGVITRADVESAMLAVSSTPSPLPPATVDRGSERRIPMSGFRNAVATSMSRSRSEIPEATVWVDVDATPLVQLREQSRLGTDPGPGLLAYIGRFVVVGLRQYPALNGRVDIERHAFVEFDHINLGLAMQTDRGLVVPAVLGAHALSTAQLDAKIRGLTSRAREGRATHEELTAGTFTLNNYGGFNVDGSAPIINHPQVAMLGLGRIIDRPWVVDGRIQVRKITQISFAFDHRVCDGGTAAGFMRIVADAIENPASAIARL